MNNPDNTGVTAANPKRVLIVDDDESILSVTTRALTKEGFEVIQAKNGQEAVKKLKESEFAVIFTDLTMPTMGGEELLKYVRQNHVLTCVNIFTGAGTVEGAVECMRLGACDYIAKPFDLDELTAMAFRCVGHYSRHQETVRLKHDLTAYEELDKLKSDLVSNVSHELRTPLFSIGGALDLLLQSIPEITDPTSKKLVGVIQNNLVRLKSIVANILNFSRIEKATFVPVFKSMDLAALAQKTIEDLNPLFLQRGITAQPDSGFAASGLIEADPEHIEQVLINLLGNAIKFTPREGRVGITLTDKGDAIEFCVWDTGCGIAPEYQNKIFDRFYQIDGSSTRETGGAGIGLSIVKSIIDMHGGNIRVESSPGLGSRMNITLPKRQHKEG
jgi:signal transduction histidine kinase